jgi:prepilin peptidase CpaA
MVISGPTIDLWENLVVFAVVLGIGTLLFSRGMLGGGDVKLFAAVGLWSDLRTAIGLVSTILIAGGVLALVMVAYRMARGKGIRKRSEAGGIPYGVAIGIGTMLTAYMAVSMGSAVG